MERIRPLGVSIAVYILMFTTFVHADAFDPTRQPAAFSAPVVLSDTGLGNGATLFQPWADLENWRGDLRAFSLDAKTGQPAGLIWSAAQQLSTRDWHERLIVTRRDDDGQAVAFAQISDLSPAQQQSLGDQATLDFLRGDRQLEGTRFRTRSYRDTRGSNLHSELGPIIHANPVYVGSHPARVYVGANDGMLHVFAADDGHEIFAYVPSMIYQYLAALADNAGLPPPYSVDGALVTGTVRFRDGTAHALLVGALGAGGQGLFALDISQPDVRDVADALHSLLWEFSDRDAAALGYSYAAPQLAQLDDGRWVVLIGNGYNDTVDDGHAGTGSAQLLIIDAETGDLIRRLDTYSGNTTEPNGLSSPRCADSNADGRIDVVYAGDLHGSLWRFDVRGDSHEWKVSCHGAPLFRARDPAGRPQPITTAPAISTDTEQGLRVLFGTGRILSAADLDAATGAQVQSLYGLRDHLGDTCPAPGTILQQSIKAADYHGQRVRYSDSNSTIGNNDLWRLDLPAGERIVTDLQLRSGRLIVTTSQPLTADGETWLLELDPKTGTAPEQIVFDMNGDGVLNSQDNLAENEAVVENDEGAHIDGQYYGTGSGSLPVFANLSADRSITYINRNSFGLRPDEPCLDNCGETRTEPGQRIPLCGTQDCVAAARSNPGRVAWKELLAE